MELFGDLERLVDDIYPYRWVILAAGLLTLGALLAVGYRRGWHGSIARHPKRTALIVVPALAVLIPVGYYTLSPLWTRTTLEEASPLAAVSAAGASTSVPAFQQPSPTATPSPTSTMRVIPTVTPGDAATVTPELAAEATAEMIPTEMAPEPTATLEPTSEPTLEPAPEPTPEPEPTATAEPPVFVPSVVRQGEFYGADDFHFGSGTALIIETEPGVFVLRFENFSVRNGPDLRVYLSTGADGYGDGSLELGALKATDGSFNYDIPTGTDVSQFGSVIIWCEPFAVLFATAPLG